MGSQKESSRPRKSAGLPSWAQESVSSTEQLMSTFYSTQEPLSSSGNKSEKVIPGEGALIPEPKLQEPTGLREMSSAPIRIALAEDQPEENASGGVLPQSPLAVDLNEARFDLRAASLGAGVEGVSGRTDKAPRTRTSALRRKPNSTSSGQGWSNAVIIPGSYDSALVELLPGKSSVLYKEFYLRTHGANPVVSEVRATKQILSSWSGIANRNTLIKHIQHLIAVRLLNRVMAAGDTEGPLYTVRRLEDVGINKDVAGAFYAQVSEKAKA
ncbi:MAG: hypothetical protein MSG64_15220 [Pyrinomonadaceae bacterium MAG19_C2-C3]|nr:hypothetical protein [Pyrinomonadaceae bacterium MAG19_C2-C3]